MRNTIGTPFKSEDPREQRKVDRINKKPWEQEARDEKGRKRFHGAFTGGFSAGYFNSVGSKEGWAPTKFVSSKGKKVTEYGNRNVMDYMDEEDINEQIGTHTITSKDIHKDFSFFEKQEEYQRKMILPENNKLLDEILPSYNSNIGNKLMAQAGYEDQTKRSQFKDDLEFNNNKYYEGGLEFKDDYYGYGYVKQFDEVINKTNPLTNFNANRIKMDRFNDDYEMGFFESNDNSQYNFEIVDEEETHNHHSRSNIHLDPGSAPKFVKSTNSLKSTQIIDFELPKLPNDYDPFKKKINNNNSNITSGSTKHTYTQMNPDKRSELLENEKNKYLKSKFTTVDEIRKKEFSSVNNANKQNPPSSTDQITNYFNFRIEIPFKDDLGKVSRFAKFVAEKEGLIIGETFHGSSNLMNASQLREERNLFQQLYEDEQKLKRAEEALKTEIRKNKEEDLTNDTNFQSNSVKREKIKWKPEKLLCKRFSVKDPYENLVESKEEKNTKGLSSLQSDILKEEARQKHFSQPQNYHKHQYPESSQSIKSLNNQTNSFVIVNAKPDLNLFEEIFGN